MMQKGLVTKFDLNSNFGQKYEVSFKQRINYLKTKLSKNGGINYFKKDNIGVVKEEK
jgi:hypothetical protein